MAVEPLTDERLGQLLESHPELDTPVARGAMLQNAFAALDGDRVVAASGIIEQWQGRGYAWFLADAPTLRQWAEITGHIRAHMRDSGFRRLEVAVEAHDAVAQRWAERLGFKRESLARSYLPTGDAYIYVLIRER